MDWIGPAVIAAAVSGIVSVVGLLVGRSTTLTTHKQKLDADQRLAERKIDADISLARAKFDYEREQAIFKRKFELSEQMLADAYQFRSLMTYVRNGFAFNNEASGREQDSTESEQIKRQKDSYFVPQARLQKENEFIGNMLARRTACHAHFGVDADRAFGLFQQAVHETRVASQLLVEWTSPGEDVDKDTMDNLRNAIWQQSAKHKGKDKIGDYIEEAVQICERLCQPVLGSVGAG